jgi:hypothetical protein
MDGELIYYRKFVFCWMEINVNCLSNSDVSKENSLLLSLTEIR